MTTLLKTFKTNNYFLMKSQMQKVFYRQYKEKQLYRQLLMDHLHIDQKKAAKIIKQDSFLLNFPKDHIATTCQLLQKTGIDITNIEQYAKILCTKPLILEHRILLLQELGITTVDLMFLSNYTRAMNLSAFLFKAHAELSQNMNLAENIFSYLEQPPNIPQLNEHLTVNEYCKKCMQCYLKSKLDISTEEEKEIWENLYMQGKSFRLLEKTITILQNEIHLSKTKLKRHIYLLNTYPNDIMPVYNKLAEISENATSLTQRCPSILRKNINDIEAVIQYLKQQGIAETALKKCPEVLVLPPELVIKRMETLLQTPELNLFRSHPKFLKLIHHFNMAQVRLRYLDDFCKKRTTVSLLTAGHELFKNSLTYGKKKTDINELVSLLNKDMKMDEEELKKEIKKHPYWKYSSLPHVKKSFEFLKKHFTLEDIYKNIYAIFYPIDNISIMLDIMKTQYSDTGEFCYTPTQFLALCIYKLEVDHHFSGNGVWSQQQKQRI